MPQSLSKKQNLKKIISKRFKKLSSFLKNSLKENFNKNIELVLYDNLKKFDKNIRKGSLIIATKNHHLTTYDDKIVFLYENKTFMLLGSFCTYEYSYKSNSKEIKCWYSILIDGKDIININAFETTNSFKNKWLISLLND